MVVVGIGMVMVEVVVVVVGVEIVMVEVEVVLRYIVCLLCPYGCSRQCGWSCLSGCVVSSRPVCQESILKLMNVVLTL